jgi:hypothetical protein
MFLFDLRYTVLGGRSLGASSLMAFHWNNGDLAMQPQFLVPTAYAIGIII